VVAKSCPEKIGAARQGNFGVRELEGNIGGLGLNKSGQVAGLSAKVAS